LRDVAEFRERLIGVVSHDLRNPLDAITRAASLLASSSHLDDREAQLATCIEECTVA
jgi:K+-sensing histidine kinase KdpD